jgi:uncharacterized membrane protein YozB (DUF420 family)/cytochrome oxidase Cu insertion factor (SCO1/SenC/PrrC family)
MRFAIPFLAVCAALVVSMLLLGMFARPSEVDDVPDLTLRDPRGQSFDLRSLNERIWVASFLSAGCIDDCEATLERLSRLRDGLPEKVPLVTFVIDGTGQWPRRPAIAEGRRGWIICQGNDVDADSETLVRQMATETLRIPSADLAGLAQRAPSAIIAPIDDRGRTLGVYSIDRTDPGDLDPAIESAWGDVEFHMSLHSGAGRDAGLHALVLVLLVTGVVLAKRGLVQIHPAFTGLATLVTMVLLGYGFGYADFAGSIPLRGSGWPRPLYFSVLLTHTILTALIVVLALTAIYHGARGQTARHTALTRWVAPAWIGVAASGAIIYFLSSIWFPGA